MAEQERPKDLDRDARLLPTVPASLGGHGMAVFERGENARWAKVLEGQLAKVEAKKAEINEAGIKMLEHCDVLEGRIAEAEEEWQELAARRELNQDDPVRQWADAEATGNRMVKHLRGETPNGESDG